MKSRCLKSQAGYALLLTLLAFMGMGGIVAAGFTQEVRQQVEDERFQHNARVLREAKQALLMYAYSYAVNNPPDRGPGRLPCPDTSNNGSPNTAFNCVSGTPIVGRIPWNDPDMNLYDIRDASNERLWYAVSQNFAHSISPVTADVINSDTAGTITIHDQSGAIRYDNGIEGIAAVIIAPGPEIDRNGTAQNRAADINNPIHFLDLFGALDNSDFVNGDVITPSANGFVLGPIFDANGDVIVNDQMILITADEVKAVAEKATLATYENAIDQYQLNTWGAGVERYPWLNAYTDIASLDIYYVDVLSGKTAGRVPFINYYVDHDSHTLITDLLVTYDIELNLDDSAVDVLDQTYINAFSAAISGSTLDISASNLLFDDRHFDGSFDGVNTDDTGTLISTTSAGHPASVTSGGTVTVTRYFWDGCPTCPQLEDGWEVCPASIVVPIETDCAMNPAGTAFVPFTGWINHADVKIRVVTMDFVLDAEFVHEFLYTAIPATVPIYTPADAVNNARFNKDLGSSVSELSVGITSDATDPIKFIDAFSVTYCEQDNDVVNDFNTVLTGNPNAGTAWCTAPVLAFSNPTLLQLDIEADYYPELPIWVKLNNWNDSILMAYSDDHKPGDTADCAANPPCLTVDHSFDGTSTDDVSILVAAGSIPADSLGLEIIFDGPNNVPDEQRNLPPEDVLFDARPAAGNDVILVLDEI